MIVARAKIDDSGLLLDFEARGHAGFSPRGGDIVCAAFTVLARTAYTALVELPGVIVMGKADLPGSLDFKLEIIPVELRERAIGISAFLIAGISGLEREFPSEIGWTVESSRRV